MGEFSTDLLFLLIFGAFLVFQYLMQRFRASKRQQEAPQETMPQTPEPQDSGAQWEWVVPDAAPEAVPIEAATIAPPRPVASEAMPPPRRRPRFSREALMGDKRKLQDAMVIAAIIGPCRAMQPHDTPQ